MINDYVHLTEEDCKAFADITIQLANEKTEDTYAVPSDLFFTQNIPLREVMIERIGRPQKYEFYFPEISGDLKDEKVLNVGEVVLHGQFTVFKQTIMRVTGDKSIKQDRSIVANGYKLSVRDIYSADKEGWLKEVENAVTDILSVWYGIQIALLNPYVKDVFRTETIRKTGFNPNGKKRKSVVKYVRHHYLNPGALSPDTENGQFLRKTMAWYVCGHWRHYQNGNTIFIQPYWKGPLRETKVCEPRERKVV